MVAFSVEESTGLDADTHNPDYYSKSFGPFVYDDGAGYYGYMWYGKLRDGKPADIAAEGDRAQIIYISPAHDVVIVRNGTDFGIGLDEWTDAMRMLAIPMFNTVYADREGNVFYVYNGRLPVRAEGYDWRERKRLRDSWSALVVLRDWIAAGEPS